MVQAAGEFFPWLYVQGKEAYCLPRKLSCDFKRRTAQAHGPQLGHLHAGPVWTYPYLCQGLDELLRDRHEVQRRGRTGSLATAADPDVLLEAVGQGAKADWRAYQARVSKVSGDTDGPEQEGLLASCQDVCDQLRVVKEYLARSGACFSYAHCGSGFTIRLRPDDFYEPPRADPHAWWCGEGRLNTVPYPIGRCFFIS